MADNFFDRTTKALVDSHALLSDIDVKYLFSDKLGVNTARNRGLSESRGDIFLFLDDDCKLDGSEYLSNLKKLHQSMPHIKGIGGRYKLPKKFSPIDLVYHTNSDQWLSNSKIDEFHTNQLIGGNMSFKRDIFDQGLRFNEKIYFGSSELEFNIRLINAGHKLVLSENLNIIHLSENSIKDLFKKSYLQGFHQAKYCSQLTQKVENKLHTQKHLRIISFLQKEFYQLGVLCAKLTGESTNNYPLVTAKALLILVKRKLEKPYGFIRSHAWKLKMPFWFAVKFVGLFLKKRKTEEKHKSRTQIIIDRWSEYTKFISEVIWAKPH